MSYQLIEVDLKNKPDSLLAYSQKGTVPVLVTEDGVIDESLEIMDFALSHHDPYQWQPTPDERSEHANALRTLADCFIPAVQTFKYADRFPNETVQAAHQTGKQLFTRLDQHLTQHTGLHLTRPTLADYAWLPFIRQWHLSQPNWLTDHGFHTLKDWLDQACHSPHFTAIMTK